MLGMLRLGRLGGSANESIKTKFLMEFQKWGKVRCSSLLRSGIHANGANDGVEIVWHHDGPIGESSTLNAA